VLADLRHRHAVGKNPNRRQDHALTRGHGSLQAVGVVRLDADDLDFRAQVFHVRRDARDQTTAAHGYEDRIQRPWMLAQNLHRHGALPGNGVRIIVGVNVDVAFFVDQFQRVGQRLWERVAMQHHFTAARAHAFDLDLRGGLGHHNSCLDPQHLGSQGQALRMVARRRRDYAACALFSRQLSQLVVRAANLEREHRLQVFALEPNLVTQPLGELAGSLQGGFHGDVVNARGEDFFDVVFKHRQASTSRVGQGQGV